MRSFAFLLSIGLMAACGSNAATHDAASASAAVVAAGRAPVYQSVAHSTARPRREAMTSRSSMSAPRRHPHHSIPARWLQVSALERANSLNISVHWQ